jgi:hypothetical protein
MDYEKSLVKSQIKQDVARCCELENLIHVWKSEKSLSNKQNINNFKNIFEKLFEITDIVYDFSKVYIYRFKMTANKIGIIKRNKYANFDIIVKEQKDNINNETCSLGLMNTGYFNSRIEMRKGTPVIFYISDLYI